MATICDFIVSGVPRTPQTKSAKSRGDWKHRVAAAATAAWPPDMPPLMREIQVVIVYFYVGETTIDVDNIGKLIIDALKTRLVDDDGLVSQVILRKTDQTRCAIENPSPALVAALGSEPDFVYVAVVDPPRHEELPL